MVYEFSEMCVQHGKEYNDTPARKLSQSFCLDIVGGKAITPKQVETSVKSSMQYSLLGQIFLGIFNVKSNPSRNIYCFRNIHH